MPTKQHDLSIILYGLRFSPLPFEEKLKKLRDIGYRSIQGGAQEGMNNGDQKKLIDSLDIEFSCMYGGFEDMEKNPGKYIDTAHVFDCDQVMIGTMPEELRMDYDGYMKFIERVNTIGRVLAKDGLRIGYHNHAQEFRKFPNGKMGMDLLFDGFDPQAVQFLLDTHWVHSGGGDILWWLERCKGRISYLHVKDYRIAPANYTHDIGQTNKQFAQIGKGNLPWQLIVDKAKEVGVKAFIVEQDFTYGEDPYDCAATSFATLKACGLN